MSEIRLPRMFFSDHADRDLPTPVVLRESSRYVWVDRGDPALPELLQDARYYSEGRESFMPDSVRYCEAAARLLRAYYDQR